MKKINRQHWLHAIRKMGFWAFLFFLLKGVVWLIVGYIIIK